jgi:hypothetical protein
LTKELKTLTDSLKDSSGKTSQEETKRLSSRTDKLLARLNNYRERMTRVTVKLTHWNPLFSTLTTDTIQFYLDCILGGCGQELLGLAQMVQHGLLTFGVGRAFTSKCEETPFTAERIGNM